MIIEYALIAGLVEAVAAAVKEQKQLPIKESIGLLNSDRNRITQGLIKLGKLKIDCCSKEMLDFLSMYNSFINLSRSYGYSLSIKCAFNEGDISRLNDALTRINRAKKQAGSRDINYHLIEFAVADKKMTEKDIIMNNCLTRTLVWITFPVIKENKLLKSQELLFGGKVGEYAVAASGCPHLVNSETKYRKALKDEKGSKEIIRDLNNARKEFDKIECKISEVHNVLEHENEKLSKINSKIGLYINNNNGVEYEFRLVEQIVKQGIETFNNILRIICIGLFDEKGLISGKLKYMLGSDSFQKMVASKLDFDTYDKYYQKFIDVYSVKEKQLSDNNIKIIDSVSFGTEVKYFYYYLQNKDNKWVECDKDSKLCYEDKFVCNIENNLNELVDELEKNLSLGVMNTSLFYLGNVKTFKSLKKIVSKDNVELIYLGDAYDEQ